jgi:hypothetical protein
MNEDRFSGRFQLIQINSPDLIKEVGEEGCRRCESFKEIILYQSITIMSKDYFSGLFQLTRINIIDSINKLDERCLWMKIFQGIFYFDQSQ